MKVHNNLYHNQLNNEGVVIFDNPNDHYNPDCKAQTNLKVAHQLEDGKGLVLEHNQYHQGLVGKGLILNNNHEGANHEYINPNDNTLDMTGGLNEDANLLGEDCDIIDATNLDI